MLYSYGRKHLRPRPQADVRRVFATGYFAEVVPDAEDTRDGVKLRIRVRCCCTRRHACTPDEHG
jgi:hypothetical protein